ncbi:MAG: 2-phospho-L-lactate guanylyltransferase, partial [Hyphomicrobiales bacterium]|nr:2-phospho-L-lactate guanylyltransferase [Hyphomicrobiales bacterium]
MNAPIHAVVPIKATSDAKRRLADVLGAARRQQLALAMFEDVLATLTGVRELAGIIVVTVDPAAAAIAARHGARVCDTGAREGHTGAVAAAARELAAQTMLTLPGDIPLVESDDICQLIDVHRNATGRGARGFTIVPARDERSSNAILCSPAAAVPLRFGADSFLPHLAAAKRCAIEPSVVRLPRIALDIDTPDDLALFRAIPSPTRTR